MKPNAFLAAALAAAAILAPLPALAADNVCLVNARIKSWEPVDDRTLIVTDQSGSHYKVNLGGICIGLDRTLFAIAFVTTGEFSCIKPGDAVRFNDVVFGPQRCSVVGVEAYTPPPEEAATPAGAD